MSSFSLNQVQLLWGCEPTRQFEVYWIEQLLFPAKVNHINAISGININLISKESPILLVESGLLLLGKDIDKNKIVEQQNLRKNRIQSLSNHAPFVLFHISDEEGFDGDQLYPLIPSGTKIWRNFPYPRFSKSVNITSFPIGPRKEFFGFQPFLLSSKRIYPWTFMGTIWSSGSRKLAVSLFLRSLPSGLFFGGKYFGLGLPLDSYRLNLLNSIFSLCPEGDRHLDTFRLYESMQMGCIPLVVDKLGQGREILGDKFPLPVFLNWQQALTFALRELKDVEGLNLLQIECQKWWGNYKSDLSEAMKNSLIKTIL